MSFTSVIHQCLAFRAGEDGTPLDKQAVPVNSMLHWLKQKSLCVVCSAACSCCLLLLSGECAFFPFFLSFFLCVCVQISLVLI